MPNFRSEEFEERRRDATREEQMPRTPSVTLDKRETRVSAN